MERKIIAYQITETYAGFSKDVRKFVARSDTTCIEKKEFSGDIAKVTVTLMTAPYPRSLRHDHFALSIIITDTDSEVGRFVTHPYTDPKFIARIYEIFTELNEVTIKYLCDSILFRNTKGEDDSAIIKVYLNDFKKEDKVPESSRSEPGAPAPEDHLVNHTENPLRSRRDDDYDDEENRRVNRRRSSRARREANCSDQAYRSRFGHRNAEDHRRTIIYKEDIVRSLLKPIMGRVPTQAFLDSNEIVGEIKTTDMHFEQVRHGKVITLTVEIEIEEL